MTRPGRTSTACEYPGDGGSASDFRKRTAFFGCSIFWFSFSWVGFHGREMIPAVSKHTTIHAVRMTPPPSFRAVNSSFPMLCLGGADPAGTLRLARLHHWKLYFRQCFRLGPALGFDPVNLTLRPAQAELTVGKPRCEFPIGVLDGPVTAEMEHRGDSRSRQLESPKSSP